MCLLLSDTINKLRKPTIRDDKNYPLIKSGMNDEGKCYLPLKVSFNYRHSMKKERPFHYFHYKVQVAKSRTRHQAPISLLCKTTCSLCWRLCVCVSVCYVFACGVSVLVVVHRLLLLLCMYVFFSCKYVRKRKCAL